jgi:mono/diheme cytochrome c family protein
MALLAFVLAAAACGPKTQVRVPSGPDGGETGAQIYGRACAPCHGADGTGHGPQAASLRVPPSDLTRLRANAGGTYPRQLVIDTITGAREVGDHGTREMPVWRERFGPTGQGATAVASVYARRRTEALADYVETLQRP